MQKTRAKDSQAWAPLRARLTSFIFFKPGAVFLVFLSSLLFYCAATFQKVYSDHSAHIPHLHFRFFIFLQLACLHFSPFTVTFAAFSYSDIWTLFLLLK